jgi:class 3 adenylate cyclase
VREVPSGTVTFVFTDIEGSTRLLQELGNAYADLVSDHRRIMRETMTGHGGREVDTQGDAFFFSFPRARDAVGAAAEAQRALAAHDWPGSVEPRVRMGLHTGEPQVGEEGYLGMDVVRAARICSAGHGGQILLSETTRALLGNTLPERASIVDLGRRDLKDVQHEQIFQLLLDDGPESFPPLKTAEASASSADELGNRISESVNRYVEQQLETAFSAAGPKRGPGRDGLGATLVSLVELVALAAAIVAIVLLVKLAF